MSGTTPLARIAGSTPTTRDRYVDLLRAFSIFVVVFGHWLMAIVYLDDGRLSGESALAVVPGLWLATWILQVMPLFFFVGGFSHSVAWRSILRRDGAYGDFIRSRTERLLRPTLVFVTAWTALAVGAGVIAPNSFATLRQGTEVLAKPLWFLAVYVLVVALAPVMLALHKRFGARVLVGLGIAAAAIDVVRVGLDVMPIGYLNFAFVWLFAHQLGFFYADGSLARFGRAFFAKVGIASLGMLTLLTGTGIYSPSMVGAVSEGASNNTPPSICLVFLTLWLVSLAMFMRGPMTRRLQRPRPWLAVVAANSMIMTVFLWHLTALLVAVLVVLPLGFPQPDGGTALWWAWRPLWLAILVAILAVFVIVFGRFERPRPLAPASPRDRLRLPKVAAGTAALTAGLAGFAQFGFPAAEELVGSPLVHLALVVAGHRLLVHGRAEAAS